MSTMDLPQNVDDTGQLDNDADLQAVLTAWHTATVRLEQTHQMLREEVRRLTDELEDKNRELARANRLADLGRMAAHVAHEVRNNLVPVTLYLSMLQRRLESDDTNAQLLAKVTRGFSELESTVTDLLYFAIERGPITAVFSLRDAVDSAVVALGEQLVAQEIETAIDVPADILLQANADMFGRALLHLIRGAIDAMPTGGRLAIRGERDDQIVSILIADTGDGLADSGGIDAFEPFCHPSRGGTGLELAIVQRIAEIHGGRTLARTAPEGGAIFSLHLPARPSDLDHESEPGNPSGEIEFSSLDEATTLAPRLQAIAADIAHPRVVIGEVNPSETEKEHEVA